MFDKKTIRENFNTIETVLNKFGRQLRDIEKRLKIVEELVKK